MIEYKLIQALTLERKGLSELGLIKYLTRKNSNGCITQNNRKHRLRNLESNQVSSNHFRTDQIQKTFITLYQVSIVQITLK